MVLAALVVRSMKYYWRAQVACAVAKKAYEAGVATALPKPHSVMDAVKAAMYRSSYRKYR